MIRVVLLAPCRWHRAVLNAGESVSLPDALAETLMAHGQARRDEPVILTALDGPPADKLMRRSTTKVYRGSRRRDATQESLHAK